MNGGHSTHYVNLESGARQGDSVSANLLILVLEILFILSKSNKNIHGIKIFKQEYLYTAHGDKTTFFLKDISSVKIVFSFVDSFFKFLGLRSYVSKCDIAGIGVLKNVHVTL